MNAIVLERRDNETSVGEIHNDGLRYVLMHFDGESSAEAAKRGVVELVNKFAREVDDDVHVTLQHIPQNLEQAVSALKNVQGSMALREGCRRLLNLTRRNLTLSEVDKELIQLAGEVTPELRGKELERFAGTMSVARHSARFWAPGEQGGDNGIRYLRSKGATPAESSLPWYAWDAVGFFEGGWPGAIALSVLSILGFLD